MSRIFSLLLISASVALGIGCASKNYVRNETAPTIQKINELDELTARNSRDIKDVDTRAQQGIQSMQAKAAAADQKALAAGQSAAEAQSLAARAADRANMLTSTVANLDDYRPVIETSVHFGFDKFDLTARARKVLDELGTEIAKTKHYILVVDGNTDSVGPADYNYKLSQRRADSVIQYLVSKYAVPAHKVYVIGLGKDRPVGPNQSPSGRARNRRVNVRVMTNINEQGTTPTASSQPQQP